MKRPNDGGRIVIDESVLDHLFGGAGDSGKPETQAPAGAPDTKVPKQEIKDDGEPDAKITPRTGGAIAKAGGAANPTRIPEGAQRKPEARPKAPPAQAGFLTPQVAWARTAAEVEAPRQPEARTPKPVVINFNAPLANPLPEKPAPPLPYPVAPTPAPLVEAEEASDDPAALHQSGERLFLKGDFDAAAEAYRAAAALDRTSWPAHFNLGLCLESAGEFEAAVQAFEEAHGLDEGRTEARLRAAVNHLRTGQPEKALHYFEGVLDRDPENSLATFGKGVATQQLGQWSAAKDCYKALLRDHSESEDLMANLAVVSLALKDYARAKEYAETLDENAGKRDFAIRLKAECAIAQADEETAAQCSAQLVEMAEDSYDAWFNLGVACQRTGRLEVAVDAYKQAMLVDPKRTDARVNLGAVLQESENLQEARQLYEAALQVESGHPGIRWNLGLIAETQGMFEEAERHYAAVTASQPHWKEAAGRLSRLNPAAG